MGFRITTNMMMNTYRYNLMNSTNTLSDARDKVLTHRNFNSYAEDPASATQAFRLRQQWWQTQNQIDNNTSTYTKFHNAWTNIGGIITNMSDANGRMSAIRGNNDPTGEGRSALAQVLRQTASSVIQSMNSKIGEQFIFAGNDGLNVPFSWNEDESVLYYRGVNVNAGEVEKPTAPEPNWLDQAKKTIDDGVATGGPEWSADDQAWYDYLSHATSAKPTSAEPQWVKDIGDKTVNGADDIEKGWAAYYMHTADDPPTAKEPNWLRDANGDIVLDPVTFLPETMPSSSTDEVEQGWIDWCKDQSDLKKLEKMSGEHLYIDLGMGLKENDKEQLVNGSAFDTALCGINFIDYGVDEDGDPKNLALVMKELAGVLDKWSENGQKYLPEKYHDLSESELKELMKNDPEAAKEINAFHVEYEAKANRLMDKLNAAQAQTTERYVELNARSSFLQTNEERLSTQALNLNEEVLEVEQIDLAAAITQFTWDYSCYSAALKIGNQLLSQSLIDYMN